MKKLILIFALLSMQVFAQPATPEQVASECIVQMQMGVCRARPDRTQIAPGQTMLISGVGRVSYAAYADYMDLLNEANPSDPAMCDLALRYMKEQPGGDHDKIARAMWEPQLDSPKAKGELTLANSGVKIILIVAMAFLIFKFSPSKGRSV